VAASNGLGLGAGVGETLTGPGSLGMLSANCSTTISLMDWTVPKRFKELPVFQVASISVSEIPGKSRVAGVFDSLDGVKECPGYLLWWAPDFFDSVWGRVTQLSVDTREAVFLADAEIGDWNPTPGALRYLSDVRKPAQVWMISVPTWQFERRVFQGDDAFAVRRSPDAAPPPPTGEAVKFWLEITSAASPAKKRYYPNRDVPEGLVSGGWDHEHCELCGGHIDPGQVGYLDRGGNWACGTCYQQYIHPQ